MTSIRKRSKQVDTHIGRILTHYAQGQVDVICQSMVKGGHQRTNITVI